MRKFKLEQEHDGANAISVINVMKEIQGDEYSLYWRIELKNVHPIDFLEFIDEYRFVAADETAHVWIFDLVNKKEILVKKFSRETDGKVAFSDDRSQLFVCYTKDGQQVDILNLLDYSIRNDQDNDMVREDEGIYNVIPLKSIEDKDAVLTALDFMIERNWKQVKHYLAFLFKNNSSQSYTEKEFFEGIWEIDGALDRMENIAKAALNLGVHDKWGGDDDETVLFNLFYRL